MMTWKLKHSLLGRSVGRGEYYCLKYLFLLNLVPFLAFVKVIVGNVSSFWHKMNHKDLFLWMCVPFGKEERWAGMMPFLLPLLITSSMSKYSYWLAQFACAASCPSNVMLKIDLLQSQSQPNGGQLQAWEPSCNSKKYIVAVEYC